MKNQILFSYDYSHLVGSSVEPHTPTGDAENVPRFEDLLTDYDRILLGFGLRIRVDGSLNRNSGEAR